MRHSKIFRYKDLFLAYGGQIFGCILGIGISTFLFFSTQGRHATAFLDIFQYIVVAFNLCCRLFFHIVDILIMVQPCFYGFISFQCLILDGRPLDPKLIRVLPILKRVSNSVPKPPTPTCLRKSLGCSWSAFRGQYIFEHFGSSQRFGIFRALSLNMKIE